MLYRWPFYRVASVNRVECHIFLANRYIKLKKCEKHTAKMYM